MKRYEEIIRSTAIIVKSKFKDWYKIDSDFVLTETNSQTRGYYFTWVTDCLKEILKKKRLLEREKGDEQEMNNIAKKASEMNMLLNIMLTQGEAQKLLFDQRRVDKTISEFRAIKTSITNQLIRKTSSGGEERM